MRVLRILSVCVLAVGLVMMGCSKQKPLKLKLKPGQTAQSSAVNTAKPFSYEVKPFKYKSYNINDVKASMSAMEADLAENLKGIKANGSVNVIGHADASGPENPEGDKMGNIALSEKRAKAVVDYLMFKYNVSRDIFNIIGRGASDLRSPTDPYSKSNRRVIIEYTGK